MNGSSALDAEQRLRRLVEWASALPFEAIPPGVLGQGALIVADNLGAIVAARDEPEVTRFHEQSLSRPGPGEATIFRGGRSRSNRQCAAVANAIAANWCELEEGYRKVSCHGGLYILPALLAEAEAEDLSVADVLRAAVLAYEIVTRVACAWRATLLKPSLAIANK